MKLVLDFLIFISELVMFVCAIAFVVVAVRFVFSLVKEAVSVRFPKVTKVVEKNYRYWLIAIFVVLNQSILGETNRKGREGGGVVRSG